jgi:hypothetical protein
LKVIMMSMRQTLAVLGGLIISISCAGAQDFRVEDVPSVTAVPVGEIKPKTILFSDHRNDQLADPGSGLIRFETWAQAKPVQKQFLGLYPGYAEPIIKVSADGAGKTLKERLYMYVAEARFALDKRPASVDLARYATLAFLQRIDPAIKHRLLTPEEIAALKDAKPSPNRSPERSWCEGRKSVTCMHSRYQLEGRLPMGIALANKLRESNKKIADYLEFQSELAVLAPAEIDQAGLRKLTGLDAPVAGVLEQSIFQVNQVMQFGKFLAVTQPHPADANKTIVTAFVALAVEAGILEKKKEYEKVPVLRNLVPAQVLAGNSSFNTGTSISSGLPNYARNRMKAIAGILERE